MTDFRIVKHCSMGRDPDVMLSPISGFWEGCPNVRVDPEASAFEIFDDFTSFEVGDATAKWTLDQTNGVAALVSAEEDTGVGGVVAVGTNATLDNDFANLKVSSTDTGAPFRLLDATTGKDLWFAIRIYTSSIAANSIYYVGLFEQSDTEYGVDDTGARNMTDGIYFRTLAATPTEIDWCCTKDSTETEVGGAVGTLAATTWTVLGFKYDASNQVVVPYLNGAQLSYPMSTSLANFPDDQGLTVGFFTKTGDVGGAAKTIYVDWVKCVQKR